MAEWIPKLDLMPKMRLLTAISILLCSIPQAYALSCAPPTGTPEESIVLAYDKSDLVAIASKASIFRQGVLAIKAVWKGDPERKISVKFTWADIPSKGNFVVFASKTKDGFVDEVICLGLWGQREQLLRGIYGAPIKAWRARGKGKI